VPATSKAQRPAVAPPLSFEPGDRPERSYAHERSLSTANKAAIDTSLGRFMAEGDLVADGAVEVRTSSLRNIKSKESTTAPPQWLHAFRLFPPWNKMRYL
jgi:hypothetical protein